MEMKTAEAPSSKMTDRPAGWGKFFLPGPTEVLPEVLEAQLKPMIGHRSGEFKKRTDPANEMMQVQGFVH